MDEWSRLIDGGNQVVESRSPPRLAAWRFGTTSEMTFRGRSAFTVGRGDRGAVRDRAPEDVIAAARRRDLGVISAVSRRDARRRYLRLTR
jgi:hypothetical protein